MGFCRDLCQYALISKHHSTLRLGNVSNPFTKVEDLALFFLPIIFKPYCVSKEIQSICFCFFKMLLFCKSYLMSQSPMSLNKAICFPIEGYRSLQGINETRTSGILDLTDLYHISRVSLTSVSFLKSISIGNCSPPPSVISHTLQNVVSRLYFIFSEILILTIVSQIGNMLSGEAKPL